MSFIHPYFDPKIKNQRAISLLEVMLVLVVAVGIILAAARYYTITRLNQQINEAATMINNVYVAAVQYFSHDDLNTINVPALVNNGTLPADFALANANPWNGQLIVSGEGSVLTVVLQNVPEKACQNLSERLASQNATERATCEPSAGLIRSLIVTFNLKTS